MDHRLIPPLEGDKRAGIDDDAALRITRHVVRSRLAPVLGSPWHAGGSRRPFGHHPSVGRGLRLPLPMVWAIVGASAEQVSDTRERPSSGSDEGESQGPFCAWSACRERHSADRGSRTPSALVFLHPPHERVGFVWSTGGARQQVGGVLAQGFDRDASSAGRPFKDDSVERCQDGEIGAGVAMLTAAQQRKRSPDSGDLPPHFAAPPRLGMC